MLGFHRGSVHAFSLLRMPGSAPARDTNVWIITIDVTVVKLPVFMGFSLGRDTLSTLIHMGERE